MLKNRTRVVALIAGALIIPITYNNCGGDLPSEVNTPSSSPAPVTTAAPSVVVAPLNLSLSPATITTAQTSQAVATGGQPPYSYSVVSGNANINAQGNITGPFSVGAVIISVTDQAFQNAQVALVVNAVNTTPTPTPTPTPNPTYLSCPSPFGGMIAHGSSLVAFRTATIYCPSTEVCASEVRVCNNGVLSGSFTAPSCTSRACVYKATQYATQYASGQQLCQININDNGSVSTGVSQVGSPSMLPPACSVAQYNSGESFCHVQVSSMGGGGDSAYEVYQYTRYTCRGVNETVTPQLYQIPDHGGN